MSVNQGIEKSDFLEIFLFFGGMAINITYLKLPDCQVLQIRQNYTSFTTFDRTTIIGEGIIA